jgi:hypothetical protein
MSKRGREDLEGDAAAEAAHALGAAARRGAAAGLADKLRALERAAALVDPSDGLYTAQVALVDADAAFYLAKLLADESEAVQVAAARLVAALCALSAPAAARLAAGPLPGLESTVAKVQLNPVQGEFVDAGAVALLVPWLHAPDHGSGGRARAEAAADALAALTRHHHGAKLAALEALASALAGGALAAAEPLELLVEGMDCSSAAARGALSSARGAALAALRAPAAPPHARVAALNLLGMLAERGGEGAAAELRADGAAPVLARHLTYGLLPARDAAARALWLVARGDCDGVLCAGGEVGAQAGELAAQLRALLREAADEEEARKREEDGAAAGARDSPPPPSLPAWAHGSGANAEAPDEVCNAEEVAALLAALVARHPELGGGGDGLVPRRTSCVVM